jgi:hypothetical protein
VINRNRMPIVIHDEDDFPKELKPVIVEYIHRYAWLLPAWCSDLHIVYRTVKDKNPDVAAELTSEESYRNAVMVIYAGFLTQDDKRRRKIIVHEMIHITVNPLGDFALRAIRNLAPDKDEPKLNAVLQDELTERWEAVTEDLANIIVEMEDRLAEQIGESNLDYNMMLITERALLDSRGAPEIEPRGVEPGDGENLKRAQKSLRQRFPEVGRAKDIGDAVRSVSRKRKKPLPSGNKRKK